MIKTVIRLKNDTVMVFDARGEQMKAYQGEYNEVRKKIQEDAPPDAMFLHWSGRSPVPETVGREDW